MPILMCQGFPLLVTLNAHFDVPRREFPPPRHVKHPFLCGQEGKTLIVTSKQNLPNLGHRYGFWAGDSHHTHTNICPTHTRLPAWVHKSVTNSKCECNVPFHHIPA